MRNKVILIMFFSFLLVPLSRIFALSENITQINFTSPEQIIEINTNSEILSIQTQNVDGIEEKISESGTKLNITSNSPTGEFSSNDTDWNSINIFGMNKGWANRNFYYKDSTPGTHLITVSAQDKSWVPATQEITIVDNSIAPDTTVPIIQLVGDVVINLSVGASYEDAGATALDDTDGNISNVIVVGGDLVDTSIVGTYIITYDVKDLAGNNATQVTRTINVSDVAPPTISIDIIVDVPATCDVTDVDNVIHTHTTDSLTSYIGICALKASLDSGLISSVSLSNKYPSMGLFVTAFNNVEALSDSQYWALYKNESYTDFGISTLPISVDDVISFKLSDFAGVETGDRVNIKIKSLVTTPVVPEEPVGGGGSGGGGGSATTEKDFSIPDALDFLIQNKESVSMFVYDWIAIAAVAGGNEELKSSLTDYLKSNPINSSTITENERRAMALMALDINPYDGTEVDYIKKIINSFDGEQFKDDSLSDFNDDIFALIVLKNAGYDEDDEIIKKTISYVISNQSSDGSWGSVDMTSAGIMAFKNFEDVEGVSNAISDAESYLIESQKEDRGFDDSFATSWAVQALSLNNSYNNEVKDAIEYLADEQEEDGGLEGGDINTRVWATAYAIPAVLKLSWFDVLNEFSKPKEIGGSTSTDNNSNENKEIVLSNETPLEFTQVAQIEEKTISPKKVYTYLDFIDQVNNEIKNENIQNEDLKEGLIGVEESDLLANAGSSIDGEFLSGKNIIIFISLIIAMFLAGFVIKRKF